MNKIYFLGTCSTCATIIKETGIRDLIRDKKRFKIQDIKTEMITETQIDELKKLAGSYESLFSRRAIKYKELRLKDKLLTEKDYRRLILDEYTFLKRPVVLVENKIFIGSEKKTVLALKEAIKNLISKQGLS